METITTLLESSNMPFVTAFLLGILTAISPCPLATNITAVGYIGKDLSNKHLIFWNGILYTLGRIITYSVLGTILITIIRQGSSIFTIQKSISQYSELFISPLLLIIGLFMLFGHKLNLPKIAWNNKGDTKLKNKGGLGALFLGIIFSLAFCPTSGVFYFGMLIPISAAESNGYSLPVVFAIATGLPVLITAWLLAYSIAGVGRFYHRIQIFQAWFSKIVAILFILIGIYYAIIFYL